MPPRTDRRPFRRLPAHLLYGVHLRLHASNLGVAGLFILLLLLAMNHRHGWLTR
ncbi:MAG TPA: hypothetical protein VFT95_13980 [Micromonosporaceae bacterium]|nr:hypothetical protein [Micromonosporaceae bacterium]